jgi:predicted NACHT family NTPase
MAKRASRSLQLPVTGINTAKRAIARKGLTQQALATQVLVSRASVAKFFAGQPVDRRIFLEISAALEMNWENLAELEPIQKDQDKSSDIKVLVQEIRERIRPIVHERCGTMRVLDMDQPIELTGERGIYANVNVLERVTGRRRLEIAEIFQNCGVEEFDRIGLNRVTEGRVPGLDAVEQHSKLMVLGKPGAGKSTFLKYLAMQCIEGNFQANYIPVFITLKDFAELEGSPNLFIYISQLLELPTSDSLREILQQGQMLVLLDGLDEVREEDTKRVLRQISEFSDQFHRNQFVMTCRIAAKEYTFERFTEVEVADFDSEQIAIFAQNWFRRIDPAKAERFIQKLEENEPIRELASSPLLLTLLCLVFGESVDFPANRSELYKEGLDVLLKKWDGKRNIQRDQLYKNISLKRKEDLLSQIALITFERKDYFFKQKAVEAYITDFICNLPNVDSDPEVLQLDSEAALKSIEAQHGLFVERARGIYSFSHLTFQEYFAARAIIANSACENLVTHLTEKRWREVFLLTANMLHNADDLLILMKQQVDELLNGDQKLQDLLTWVVQKSTAVKVPYKSTAVKAFYLAIALALNLENGRELALPLDLAVSLDLAFDPNNPAIDHIQNPELNLDLTLARNLDLARAHTLALDLDFSVGFESIPDSHLTQNNKLQLKLQEHMSKLPSVEDGSIAQVDWWRSNEGRMWTEQLRSVVIEHRDIGYDWQFSDKQQQLLQQYYDANKLLVNCLNSDCYVSREVRQEIEDTLLLPMSEITKRKQHPEKQ